MYNDCSDILKWRYVDDEEIGLYYLRSRYYCQLMCRFINTDTLVGRVRIIRHNLFSYCDNKPDKYIDTQGTEPYDMFDSELEAVTDFAECYNDEPIEYAAVIFENEGQYFYAEPQSGTEQRVAAFNLNPDIPISGTPVSFVHSHTNNKRILQAFWPSDADIQTLCASTYSHSYLVVPDGSFIKMEKTSSLPTITESSSLDERWQALLDVEVYAISGGVKNATKGKTMNFVSFSELVSAKYQTKVDWFWWLPFIW